jgi:SAM-dependent methyltransferase
MGIEFNTVRSKSYKNAISAFPNVWKQDLQVMHDYLSPMQGDTVVELGAGSGFYSKKIAECIGPNGQLYVVEPSLEQLLPIIYSQSHSNICFHCDVAEGFELPGDVLIDKVWTRGAFHHVRNKELVMRNLAQSAHARSEVYIFDIFSGSSVAKFFDGYVAHACTTGHEVSFLSKEYAESMCITTGWECPEFVDIPLQWEFDSRADVGLFLSMLLSIKESYSCANTLDAAQKYLGIESSKGKYFLNWPMTLMMTQRGAYDIPS